MKVYVLKMVDEIGNNGASIFNILGVYKRKSLAQKDMRKCIRSDIESAKYQGLEYESEIGEMSAIIKYDTYDNDYIEYEITLEKVKEQVKNGN